MGIQCTIASLAAYVDVKRPSLSRVISEMVKDGLIEFESGKEKILNYNEIKRMLG